MKISAFGQRKERKATVGQRIRGRWHRYRVRAYIILMSGGRRERECPERACQQRAREYARHPTGGGRGRANTRATQPGGGGGAREYARHATGGGARAREYARHATGRGRGGGEAGAGNNWSAPGKNVALTFENLALTFENLAAPNFCSRAWIFLGR